MRSFLTLLGYVSAYSGTCSELSMDKVEWWHIQIYRDEKFGWGGKKENPGLRLDLDNKNKTQEFAINDETYILITFTQTGYENVGLPCLN